MFFVDYEKYIGQYVPNSKKISFRSFYYKQNESNPVKESSFGNYDLFFNEQGLLLHSIHFDKNEQSKIIYGYDNKQNMISALSLKSKTNQLISYSENKYNNENKIIEESIKCYYFSTPQLVGISQRFYKYTKNTKEVILVDDDDDNPDVTIYSTYNEKGNLIEEKVIRAKEEIIIWNRYEFDNKDELTKEISLDENGNPNGSEMLYYQLKDSLDYGYSTIGQETNYQRDFKFVCDSNGNWIVQNLFTDGKLHYTYERVIDYY